MEFRDKPMENLIRLQEKDICKNINALLLEGEQIVGAYRSNAQGIYSVYIGCYTSSVRTKRRFFLPQVV